MVKNVDSLAQTTDSLIAALDQETASEAAASLGHAGRMVERAMQQLNGCAGDDPRREHLLADAATAVYHYFIQRETMGMRRHEGVIREYEIPREVLVRLGAIV